MVVLHIIARIVAGILLAISLMSVLWAKTHIRQVKSAILRYGLLPPEAPRGNVWVLFAAVGTGLLGLLVYIVLG